MTVILLDLVVLRRSAKNTVDSVVFTPKQSATTGSVTDTAVATGDYSIPYTWTVQMEL